MPPENEADDKWTLEVVTGPFPMNPLLLSHHFVFKCGPIQFGFSFVKTTQEESAEVMYKFLQDMMIELRMQFPAKPQEEKTS